MKRFVMLLAPLLLACCGPAFAQGDGWQGAICRITSHGLTGTVIHTQRDRSIVLTAAHGFVEGGDRTRLPITVDVPASDAKFLPTYLSGTHPRLLGLDADRDLALVEVPAGPWPHTLPVAGPDYRNSGKFWSCGYDEMRWKNGAMIFPCTPVRDDGETIRTREIPWHGRSGGPLLDVDKGVLIGVVQGYVTIPNHPAPGMYVNTATVRSFVGKYVNLNAPPAAQVAAAPPPYIHPSIAAPAAAANDGWVYDARSGGYFRGGLTPQAAATPNPAGVKVTESPGCDCGWTGQCRCGPGCVCPECRVERRAITPGVVQVPPRQVVPQTCPNGRCPNAQPQLYAPAPSCPNGQCGRAPQYAQPSPYGMFVNPSCPGGNCPLQR